LFTHTKIGLRKPKILYRTYVKSKSTNINEGIKVHWGHGRWYNIHGIIQKSTKHRLNKSITSCQTGKKKKKKGKGREKGKRKKEEINIKKYAETG